MKITYNLFFQIFSRVLYNLEVLSGKLLPTKVEAAPKFSNDFLEAGGLRVILDVFQHDALPVDVNCDIRQSIYLVIIKVFVFDGNIFITLCSDYWLVIPIKMSF